MWPLQHACVVLLACCQTPSSPAGSIAAARAQWREIARPDSTPLRYFARSESRNPSDASTAPLVMIIPADAQPSSVERAVEDVARALIDVPNVLIVGACASAEELSTILSDCDARAGHVAHVHLIGTADGGRLAIELATARHERIASLTAFAPAALALDALERAKVLAEVPVALLRGRADDREPLMNLLERWIEVGGDRASLDFVSTREHATLLDCEGRFAEHWRRFSRLESERAAAERDVRSLLTDFHGAAARADARGYFDALTADAVFIGTDASERWSVPQFRAYCEPYFRRGQGWTYTAVERHISLSRDRAVAWFDERLTNAKYGEVRGSGVARREGARWRIAHYVMSFPVPNELSSELTRRVGELRR